MKKFEKFMLFNQDNEPVFEIRHGEFTCGILEMHGLFIVHVSRLGDSFNPAVALYRDVQEAAKEIAELKDFALKAKAEHTGFLFAIPETPISALEVIDALS